MFGEEGSAMFKSVHSFVTSWHTGICDVAQRSIWPGLLEDVGRRGRVPNCCGFVCLVGQNDTRYFYINMGYQNQPVVFLLTPTVKRDRYP